VTLPAPPSTVVVATDGPARWTMPDLVGRNLQEAQDAIQELTDFEIPITISHDATGAGREQLLDRNWKVCSQNIPPGEEITRNTRIDFGAVRTEERC
jgi:beta-lactam-binding protein with PASTA domain